MKIDEDTTVIARMVTRTVVPIILLTAIALMFQGHNLPGGGFIAGVLTATAVALVYIIYGLDYVQDVLGRTPEVQDLTPAIVRDYRTMFGFGLALAAFSGLVPLFLYVFAPILPAWAAPAGTQPFLEQGFVKFEHLPIFGEFELASAFAFDLGVYFVVVGSLLSILAVVGDE